MKPQTRALAVLRKRFPRLISRLMAGSKSGQTEIDSRSWRSRSKHGGNIVDRWLEGIELKPKTAYALTGFGDGSQIASLLHQLPENSFVFCAESNVDSFLLVVSHDETARLLEDERLFVGVGELDLDFFESLSRFPTLELTDARPLVFAPIYNESPEYYARFFTEFTRAFDYWRKLYGTNVTASAKWQRNTFKNARTLVAAPDIAEIKGAFEGIPIVMVSAGPSLDESLEFVKIHEARCVIVAVNSSYRALRNYGISPHFVIAADPSEYTDKGFDGVSCSRSVLLCPFIVYPNVVSRFHGRILTWSQNNLLASYLRLKVGKCLGSAIEEIGTVSACIFDIAKIFGSPSIVFVGQDLSVKDDGQMHVRDSFYTDLLANHVDIGECRTLPGNLEATVKVEGKLYIYLKAFEKLAEANANELALYNTSHYGVRVEGIPYVSLDEMTRVLDQKSFDNVEVKFRSVEKALSSVGIVDGQLVETLAVLSEFGSMICSLALNASLTLNAALFESTSNLDSHIVLAQNQKRDLVIRMEEDSDLRKVLEDGALKYELALYKRAIQRNSPPSDPLMKRAEDLLEYFWAISEGAFSFCRAIETSEQRDFVE